MGRRRWSQSHYLAVLALFGPSAALAQGSVTGITYEPTPVVACTLETITVTGVGSCPFVNVNFGDSTPIAMIQGLPFPISLYHTYKKGGTFPLEAHTWGRGRDCKLSNVSTNLSVTGPTVTSVFPFSVIKPLGAVILLGQHFGSLPGQFLIHVTNYMGESIDLPMDGVQWGDTFVAGTIPAMSGMLKQTVTFTIVTQCGASTTWQAPFTPLTGPELIAFERLSCSTSIGASVSDQCQNWGGTNYPAECFQIPLGGTETGPTGYFGYHASGWGGGNTGYDQFWPSPPLKNGFVFDSLQNFGWYNLGSGSEETIAGVNTSDPTMPRLGVNWHVDACGEVDYGGDIQIIGPINVPY